MSAALARPAAPREERLRTVTSLRATPSIWLSAWRGMSGRRYVVAVYGIAADDFDDLTGAVLLAVRRDAAGTAIVLEVAATDDIDASAFVARAHAAGATELHAHRLAFIPADRRALVSDLLTLREAA